MPVVSTGLLTKGLRSEFFATFQTQHDAIGQVVDTLATTIPSTSDQEDYRFLGSVPQMREWGTGRVSKGLSVESYNVKNLKYEATIDVDRDEIADDQTGQIRIRIGELAQRAATHKNFLLGQLILNGSAAGFNSYDGVPFFDASHANQDSGNQSNEITFDISNTVGGTPVPSEPDDVDRPGPKTLLAALSAGVEQMMLFVDDRGEAMHRSPSGLVIVCHWRTYYTWLEAIRATELQNATNIKGPAMQPAILAMPEMTDTSMFHLFKTDGVVKPFILQDREPIEFTALEQGSDMGFSQEIYRYGVRARYRLTYGYWQNAVSCDLV